MKIDLNRNIYTIIVDVKGCDSDILSIIDHAKSGLDHFKLYGGFIAGATHVSADSSQIIQYLQWESEQAYLDCMKDQKTNALPSSEKFMKLVKEGKLKLTVKPYAVAALVS